MLEECQISNLSMTTCVIQQYQNTGIFCLTNVQVKIFNHSLNKSVFIHAFGVERYIRPHPLKHRRIWAWPMIRNSKFSLPFELQQAKNFARCLLFFFPRRRPGSIELRGGVLQYNPNIFTFKKPAGE